MEELVGVALRASVMYLYMLLMLRLTGKRSIGNLSPIDFAVTAIIGDMFDDVFWAEIPVAQGMVGVATIIFLHMLSALVESRVPAMQRLLEGRSVTVIENGRLVEKGLRQERTSEDTVWSEVRGEGIEKQRAGEIRQAAWEINGRLALLRHKWAEPLQKGDLPQIRGRAQARKGQQ